jgi:ubiquinone/menaquinone biosynthesis C-methylase UbiE
VTDLLACPGDQLPLFEVGDACFVPPPDAGADVAFSYRILQHFPKEDPQRALAERGRVLWPECMSLPKMPGEQR